APSAHDEGVGRLGLRDAERDIALELADEPFAELSARHELALTSGERRVVHAEAHAEGRLLDADRRERPWLGGVGDGVADPSVDACHGDDVARRRLLHPVPPQTLEREALR